MTKICKVCGKKKDKTEFYEMKSYADGRTRECKKCFRERARADRAQKKLDSYFFQF